MEFILLDYCFFLSVLLMLPILIPSILKGPIPTFDEMMPGVLSDVEKASGFLKHAMYIDMGKNLFLMALALWAALYADVDAKKAIALLLAAQMAFALFIGHGFASPDKMHESYLTRIISKPPLLVIVGVQIVAFTVGVAMTP